MNVIAKSLHPRRKLLFVLSDKSIGISLTMPAVINVKIHIAGIHKAQFNHLVSCLLDKLLIDITLEFIPSIPAHLRCKGQSRELLCEKARGKQSQRN